VPAWRPIGRINGRRGRRRYVVGSATEDLMFVRIALIAAALSLIGQQGCGQQILSQALDILFTILGTIVIDLVTQWISGLFPTTS
jgi:hypothetical protein